MCRHWSLLEDREVARPWLLNVDEPRTPVGRHVIVVGGIIPRPQVFTQQVGRPLALVQAGFEVHSGALAAHGSGSPRLDVADRTTVTRKVASQLHACATLGSRSSRTRRIGFKFAGQQRLQFMRGHVRGAWDLLGTTPPPQLGRPAATILLACSQNEAAGPRSGAGWSGRCDPRPCRRPRRRRSRPPRAARSGGRSCGRAQPIGPSTRTCSTGSASSSVSELVLWPRAAPVPLAWPEPWSTCACFLTRHPAARPWRGLRVRGRSPGGR